MTTEAAVETPSAPEWPEGALYHSPLGLIEFQVDGVAESYVDRQKAIVWDTGLGKTHLVMKLAAVLREDGELTTALIECEPNKLADWRKDFEAYTRLTPLVYHGSNRKKRLAKYVAEHGRMPDVLISTYETVRSDVLVTGPNPNGRGKVSSDGPLMEYLRPVAGGLLVAWDESTKLANRGSVLYKAHERMLKELRKINSSLRVVPLTATPIETGWENAFNQFRLVAPHLMPTIGDFDAYFVKSRHPMYHTPTYHHDRMHEFALLCRPLLHRKRKTDPDVRDFFPEVVERTRQVEMGKAQRELYGIVESLAERPEDAGDDWTPPPGIWMLQRLVAAHPGALVANAARPDSGEIGKMLVEELGAEYLNSIPSAKTEELLGYLEPIVHGQGDKAVVFTFFGPTVLPLLAAELRAKKIRVYTYYPEMGLAQMEAAKAAFRADPQPCVFLTSDSGARGINLPEATYVVEYESAGKHSLRTQRINRCSRLDGGRNLLTVMTLVADGTVEVGIVERMLQRNEAQDLLLGDDGAAEGFVTARQRRVALQVDRLRKSG